MPMHVWASWGLPCGLLGELCLVWQQVATTTHTDRVLIRGNIMSVPLYVTLRWYQLLQKYIVPVKAMALIKYTLSS